MVLLVFAEPVLSAKDRSWINSLRARHDPNHPAVPPHFTLVLNEAVRRPAAMVEHIRAVAAQTPGFRARLRCALTYPDALTGRVYVSLMPDEGFAALVRLRDRLYGGPLRKHQRLDIPFVPHVTVARFQDGKPAKRLADAINAREVAVGASIRSLDIARYEGTTLVPVTRVPLG